MFYISLFRKFFIIPWRSQFEYPVAFILGITAQWMSYGFQFLGMWIMVQAFGTLAGWNSMQILFIYSMNLFSYAIGATFTYNTYQQIMQIVRTGKFDDVLLKPMNSLVYLLCSNINAAYLSHLTLGLAGMLISLHALGITMEIYKILWLVIAILGSALIHAGMLILISVPSLIVLNDTGWGIFYTGFRNFMNYPLSIFGRPIQLLLTFVLPYGFISFYPSQVILNIQDSLGFSSLFKYLTPLVGILLCSIAFIAWQWAVNRYESSGS